MTKNEINNNSDWIKEVKRYREDKEWRMTSEKISIAILRLLRKKNVNKTWLAQELGATPQYVSRLINGKENLSLKTISKIEKAFDQNIIIIRNIDLRNKPIALEQGSRNFYIDLSESFSIRNFMDVVRCSKCVNDVVDLDSSEYTIVNAFDPF